VGLFDSIKSVCATLVAIVHSRLELFSVETQEEFARIGSLMFLGAVALLLAALGLAFIGILLIVVFWDEHRMMVAILVATAFFLAALMSGHFLRRAILDKPAPFSALLAELVKDRDELRPSRMLGSGDDAHH
jgi:uncharacterized membrane protein YqjE